MSEQQVQVAIVGGGIAGLWVLNRLQKAGYDCVLVEQGKIGQGQTLASQGIIHGGLKYALNGVLSPASSAIADMPNRWRSCLGGTGELDLSNVRVLSPHYYMWSDGSVRSRFKTFLGSKALRGRIDALKPDDYPAFFQQAKSAGSRGTLYQLTDFVVDTPSLLESLASAHSDRIRQCQRIELGDKLLCLTEGNEKTVLRSQMTILCAGAGNEALLASWSAGPQVNKPAMQRRPLHMVAVRLDHPLPAYVHCVGDSFGMTPRLTVTCHPVKTPETNEWVWYLGGELAESGVGLPDTQQHQRAEQELNRLFPWVNTSGANWQSIHVDRAEPAVADLRRPDTAHVSRCESLLVCWPTKLTLCPDLGDTVLKQVAKTLTPAGQDAAPLLQSLPAAALASAPWEALR